MKTLNILVLADEESASLWDFFEPSKLEGIDLIISCGDLNPQYLSFLAIFFHGPVLYVHGNHDECYKDTPPEGCICIEDQIYEYKGLRILGLGGSMKYREGAHQYTQKQMQKRIRRLRFQLFRKKGFDLLVTHSPAYQLNDGEDLPHQGFSCFLNLLDKYHPKFFIHGHMHLSYDHTLRRISQYKETIVINAFEKYVIECPIDET